MMFMGGLGVVVMIIVLLAVAWPMGRWGTGDSDGGHAEQVLAERFAAGEIDEQEFQTRRAGLRQARHQSGRATPWGLIVGAVALALLIATLVAVGTGMGSGWWGSGGHMGMGFSGGSSDASSKPIAGAEEITVRAGDLWFKPERIEASNGAALNNTVRNDGAVFHDFTIDELDLMIDVEAGDTVTAGLSDVKPGTYDFYCSVPGHAQAGMTGTLVVDATS